MEIFVTVSHPQIYGGTYKYALHEILTGLKYSPPRPQGANILPRKTPKNINQNQIRAKIELYTNYCV